MKNTEKLLNVFTELCEDMINEAFMVTDGRRVVTTVLDYDLAVKLAKMANESSSTRFYVLNIPTAINFAFECGYQIATNERNGDNDDKDPELRERDLSEQKETD